MKLAKHNKLRPNIHIDGRTPTMPALATITDAQIHDAAQQIIAAGRPHRCQDRRTGPRPNSRVTSRQIESGSVFEPIQAWEGPNF
jgi:hypothetical protein